MQTKKKRNKKTTTVRVRDMKPQRKDAKAGGAIKQAAERWKILQ